MGELLQRALRSGVEAPERDQRVPIELEPDRVGEPDRIDVEDPAAPRELPHRLDLGQPFVAHVGEALDQLLGSVVAPDRERQQYLPQAGRQRDALDQTAHRAEHHPLLAAGQPGQGLEPLGGDARVRRGGVVGEVVRLGEGQGLSGAAEVLDVVSRLLETIAVHHQVEDGAPGRALEP